jgi:hypothetical protein
MTVDFHNIAKNTLFFCVQNSTYLVVLGFRCKKRDEIELARETNAHSTANPKILDVRYRDFNVFPVVNWF